MLRYLQLSIAHRFFLIYSIFVLGLGHYIVLTNAALQKFIIGRHTVNMDTCKHCGVIDRATEWFLIWKLSRSFGYCLEANLDLFVEVYSLQKSTRA